MKRILIILLIMIRILNVDAKTVKFDVDGAQFRFDENHVLWELYYSFPDTLLKYEFKFKESAYIGELYIHVSIKSIVKNESDKEWIVTNSSKYPLSEYKSDLIGKKDFILSPGQYEVEIDLRDLNDSTTKALIKYNLIIKNFSKNKLEISDIELAKFIEHQDGSTVPWDEIFKKNNLFVIPNPSHLFFGDSLILNAYIEVYNSLDFSNRGYKVNYKILDAIKNEEFSMVHLKKAENNLQFESISIPINILPTGVYFFEVTVSYPQEKPFDSITTTEVFYVLNPEIPPRLNTQFTESITFDKSEWSVMSEEQINDEYDKAKFIATPNEMELWKEITKLEGKRKFMFAFWNIRNPDTTKPYNEKLMEFRKLIDYANNFFSFGNKKNGWRTDRGRVLLIYGQPTQRDHIPAKGEYRPYEIWNYTEVQGGVNFYFVDLIGFGNFVLVHSTAIGEMRNENWYDQYVPARNEDDDLQFQKEYNQGIR